MTLQTVHIWLALVAAVSANAYLSFTARRKMCELLPQESLVVFIRGEPPQITLLQGSF
jgi:hypothetical protein